MRFQHHSEPSEPELKMLAILDSMGFTYEYQHPVRSGFVLDFAFPDQKKAIEVDGFYHQLRKGYDAFRDRILGKGGWSILRVPADDIEKEETILKIRAFLGTTR